MKRRLIRITESDIHAMVMECLKDFLNEGIDQPQFGVVDDDELPDFSDTGDFPQSYNDLEYEEDPDAYKGEEYVDLSDGDLYR